MSETPNVSPSPYSITPLAIIEFDERPALDHATASEQLEHLYVHMGLVQEKVNECVSMLNAVLKGLGVDD